MKNISKKRGSVAIGTVPLPEKVLGMKMKKGRVTKFGNRFFFVSGGRKSEIPVGMIVSRADIGKLVGKKVYAAYSQRAPGGIVAIGTWPTPERPRIDRYWIICYIPVPDIIRRIERPVRRALLDRMMAEGIISKKLGDIIRNARGF